MLSTIYLTNGWFPKRVGSPITPQQQSIWFCNGKSPVGSSVLKVSWSELLWLQLENQTQASCFKRGGVAAARLREKHSCSGSVDGSICLSPSALSSMMSFNSWPHLPHTGGNGSGRQAHPAVPCLQGLTRKALFLQVTTKMLQLRLIGH